MDPDPLVRGTDQWIQIRTKMSRIPNTACHLLKRKVHRWPVLVSFGCIWKAHLFLGLLQGRSEARQGWSRPTCLNSSYSSLNLQEELDWKIEGPFFVIFDLEFEFEGALVDRSSKQASLLGTNTTCGRFHLPSSLQKLLSGTDRHQYQWPKIMKTTNTSSFHLPSSLQKLFRGTDRHQYQLTVTKNDRQLSVKMAIGHILSDMNWLSEVALSYLCTQNQLIWRRYEMHIVLGKKWWHLYIVLLTIHFMAWFLGWSYCWLFILWTWLFGWSLTPYQRTWSRYHLPWCGSARQKMMIFAHRSTDCLFYGFGWSYYWLFILRTWLFGWYLTHDHRTWSRYHLTWCSSARRKSDDICTSFYWLFILWAWLFGWSYLWLFVLWLILDSLPAYLKSLSADMMR